MCTFTFFHLNLLLSTNDRDNTHIQQEGMHACMLVGSTRYGKARDKVEEAVNRQHTIYGYGSFFLEFGIPNFVFFVVENLLF